MTGLHVLMVPRTVGTMLKFRQIESGHQWAAGSGIESYAIRESVMCIIIVRSFVFFCFLFVETDRTNHKKIRTSGQINISTHLILSPAINPVITHNVPFNSMYSGIVHANIKSPCIPCIVE